MIHYKNIFNTNKGSNGDTEKQRTKQNKQKQKETHEINRK